MGLAKMVELEDTEVDQCLYGDRSAGLRTELAEADLDYNRVTLLEQCDTSNSSESETETPLQSTTQVPHLRPEKSPLDACEAAKLEQFCSDTGHCQLGTKGTPCSATFSREELSLYRMKCLELLSNELDLVILSQIASCTKSSNETS